MKTSCFAFFDVDETLISLKSMFSFLDFYLYKTRGQQAGELVRKQAEDRMRAQVEQGVPRADINRSFWQGFKGYAQSDVRAAVLQWHSKVAQVQGYYIESAVQALREHQSNGVEPVFVSGSCSDILMPLAHDLNVNHVLANRLEVEDGIYTGFILSPQTIGEGKRIAVEQFLRAAQVDAEDCYGYGDHISDLPFLDLVGFPRVVAGNHDLIAIAHQRGWPVIDHIAVQ